MKTTITFLLMAVAFVATTDANAQSDRRVKKEFVLAHRLDQWETRHFNDATKAQQHADALKQVGAEVKLGAHGGHTDVSYRSVGWKSLHVQSDALAHQWQNWLRGAGFETLHGHHPDPEKHAHAKGHDHAHAHNEVVLYRLPQGATQQFEKVARANEFALLAQALGCEVDKTVYEKRSDVRFRCAEWMAVDFPDHASATAWEKWLASAGFEVQHNHDDHAGHDHSDGDNHAGHDHDAGHDHSGHQH